MKFIKNGCKWVELIKTPFFFLVLLFSACNSVQVDDIQNWQSSLQGDHALVGTIWDSKKNQFIEASELFTAIDGVRYLLLGEKHDNPDHHALQLRVLEHFLNAEAVSTVAFEMMNSPQQALLDSLSDRQAIELREYLEWDNDGWDWNYYGPMLRAAVQAGVRIKAANISHEEMMRAYEHEALVSVSGILNEQAMQALEKEIDESHCGMLPESQFPSMVRVQQARDYSMASSLTMRIPASNTGSKMQVLIAGNYHIRRDLGVPNYLLSTEPELEPDQIISLAFLEVDPASNEPNEYLQQYASEAVYDFIWFTPAVSDEDYCASMRQ